MNTKDLFGIVPHFRVFCFLVSGLGSKDWIILNSCIISLIYLISLVYLGCTSNSMILQQLQTLENFDSWKDDSKKTSDLILNCHKVDPWAFYNYVHPMVHPDD